LICALIFGPTIRSASAQVSNPPRGKVYALAIDPANSATIYVGNDGGVSKSIDGGMSWTDVNSGLEYPYVTDLKIDPSSSGTLYAGVYGPGVFKSTNAATSWTRINSGLTAGQVNVLAIDPSTPAILYAGTNGGGVFKSSNSGTTWTAINSGLLARQVYGLAFDRSNAATVYAGTYGGGAFKSSDGGTTWTAINSGLIGFSQYINSIVSDPNTPSTLYVGSLSGTYKSSNGGASWASISSGISDSIAILAIDPSTPAALYAGTIGGGVYKSTNGGNSWNAINAGLTGLSLSVTDLAIDPANPATVFAATYNGVFKTINSGASWQAVGTGPPIPLINSGGTVNGASFNNFPPAPASIASVFGTNFADGLSVASSLPLPILLGGTRVLVNEIPAPLFAVSPNQINFQIPWELFGQTQATISVVANGVASGSSTFNLAAYSPGLFSTNQQGYGQAAILIASTGEMAAPVNSIIGRAARPARRGEFITIYGTGLGPVSNQPASGSPATSGLLSTTTSTPSVSIGGVPVPITEGFFSGLAPSFVGLYQINVRVPESAPAGNAVAVTVTIGGVTSNVVGIAVD